MNQGAMPRIEAENYSEADASTTEARTTAESITALSDSMNKPMFGTNESLAVIDLLLKPAFQAFHHLSGPSSMLANGLVVSASGSNQASTFLYHVFCGLSPQPSEDEN